MVPEVNRQNALQRISELFSWFAQTIKNQNAMGLLDINLVAEDILVPIFREIYGYHDLINLNLEQGNFPGIDLGDKKAQVAIQVTSTASSHKIKHTLDKFSAYNCKDRGYKQLIVYIITEKQSSYSGTGWAEIAAEGSFQFSFEQDIRDYTDLLKTIRHLTLDKILIIESLLERNFSRPILDQEGSAVATDPERIGLLAQLKPDLAQLRRDGTAAIYIGKRAVLAEEYAVFLRENPTHPRPTYKDGWTGQNPLPSALGKPVVGVNYNNAAAYSHWLSEVSRKRYRLPTVDEWQAGFHSGEIEITQNLAEWTSTPQNPAIGQDLLGAPAAYRMLCKISKNGPNERVKATCFPYLVSLANPTFTFRLILAAR